MQTFTLHKPIKGSISIKAFEVTLKPPKRWLEFFKNQDRVFTLTEEALILFKSGGSRTVSRNMSIPINTYTIQQLQHFIKREIPGINLGINKENLILNIPAGVSLIIPKNLRQVLGFTTDGEDEWVEHQIIGKLPILEPPSVPPPSHITLHCKQLDSEYHTIDGKPSNQLLQIPIVDSKATFKVEYPIVFLPLTRGLHRWLEFKLFDDQDKPIEPESFHLTILNKP